MSGKVNNPHGFITDEDEYVRVWAAVGQHGALTGFRDELPGVVMGNFVQKECTQMQNYNDNNNLVCGPYKMDYWTAALWFPYKDEDISDMIAR